MKLGKMSTGRFIARIPVVVVSNPKKNIDYALVFGESKK